MGLGAKPMRIEAEPASLSQTVKPAGALNTSSLPRNAAQAGPALLAIITQAASQVREVRANAHEQEEHVHKLLLQVRADMQDANARVQAAEARAREAEQRAQAVIASANDRVAAAEERAREAEDWFARITEAVRQEFKLTQGAAQAHKDAAAA